MAELVPLAGLGARAIRYYLERNLLPRPKFYGTATRYKRDHLLRLLAIRRLRAEDMSLAEIKRRLATLSSIELERLATDELPPGPTADALMTSPTIAAAVAAPIAPETLLTLDPIESWQRIALLPGLELLVKADASPSVRHVAKQMLDHCSIPR
jgi:DNA-binding transcriptional MerR regulator